jgi:hypothetical protein
MCIKGGRTKQEDCCEDDYGLFAQVVAYGISINLVEVTWKSKIKAQFPNPNDYSAFMGEFSTATGAVTFLMMIASRFIFRRFGWGGAALITPTVLLITGVDSLFSLSLSPPLSHSHSRYRSRSVSCLWCVFNVRLHE